MRLTPAQVAVHLICGRAPGPLGHSFPTLRERLVAGREFLVQLTGQDFGYDLASWHAHLKESREGGYTWGRNIELPRVMKEALTDERWREAVSSMAR